MISVIGRLSPQIAQVNADINRITAASSFYIERFILFEIVQPARIDIGTHATTGIAGPDGGTVEKPVGTVWIAYSDKQKTLAKKFNFSRDRTFIVHWSALAALNMIRLNVGVK